MKDFFCSLNISFNKNSLTSVKNLTIFGEITLSILGWQRQKLYEYFGLIFLRSVDNQEPALIHSCIHVAVGCLMTGRAFTFFRRFILAQSGPYLIQA